MPAHQQTSNPAPPSRVDLAPVSQAAQVPPTAVLGIEPARAVRTARTVRALTPAAGQREVIATHTPRPEPVEVSQAPLEPGQHYTSHGVPCIAEIEPGAWCESCGLRAGPQTPPLKWWETAEGKARIVDMKTEAAAQAESVAEPERAIRHPVKPKPTPKPQPVPKPKPKKSKPKTRPASVLTDESEAVSV